MKEFDLIFFVGLFKLGKHTHGHTAAVHHKLIGFADIELEEIFVVPFNEALIPLPLNKDGMYLSRN